jgi:hypothetical protein
MNVCLLNQQLRYDEERRKEGREKKKNVLMCIIGNFTRCAEGILVIKING